MWDKTLKGLGPETRPGADECWFRDHTLKKVVLSTTTLFGVLGLNSVHEATVSQRQFAVLWGVLSVCFLSLNSYQATGCSFQSRNSQLLLIYSLFITTCSIAGHWGLSQWSLVMEYYHGVFIRGQTKRDKQTAHTHIQTYRQFKVASYTHIHIVGQWQ